MTKTNKAQQAGQGRATGTMADLLRAAAQAAGQAGREETSRLLSRMAKAAPKEG